MTMDANFDVAEFRNALGSFTTGVTIVTTQGNNGNDVGLTANSFNSVSLDPPMVLWSLGKSALSMTHFQTADHFAVHILAQDQQDLSQRFATRGIDKFSDLDISRGPNNVPLLEQCAARFICKTVYQYEGGDHIIFVGEVISFEHSAKHPLLFPADPEECFYMSATAFDLADRLQTPVMVLSDLDIGMNDWMCPDLKWDDAYQPDRGKVLSAEDLEEVEIPIGEFGTLVIGITRDELQERLAVLRRDLLRQSGAIGVLTMLLLAAAITAVWLLVRRGRALEEQAREAERMAYIGTLASGLAHEIRNPLNALSLNMQMLDEEAERSVVG